ncbi:MAG: MarR family transcriptional regulator [Flavobacteriaceae bacterium]|nr:MarR family transcriptional regulator [Flavobacteriaceae bacterium]
MSSKNENKKGVNPNLPFETINNLLSAGNLVYEKSAEHLKQFALSVEQYNVLLILHNLDGEPANLSTIQNSMISKMSNTTRLVEKLRLKGLLTREQSQENRRKVEINITEKGILLLKEIEETQILKEKEIVKNLTKRDMLTLNKLLNKLKS